MDVKTAFLNGELDEEIYMDQPEGFVAVGQERKVCKLQRSIYGLKQSSRQWNLRFHRAIVSNGFTMIDEDHCVYVKQSKDIFLILSLYVDDILLAGNDKEMIVATKIGTADYTLCYQSSDLHLVGYCDADWGGDLDERKSTSGYAFMLSDGAISWSSKKQSCIALSTMEAEFVACSSAVQEAVWLRRFLQHLDVVTHTSDPVTIHCDSMAALAYAKDPKYHGRTKHIDVRFNFIRDILAQKEVILEHIPTSRMVADPLTKPIARDVYLTHVRALGLRRW
ncbi:hypothetical protein CsSME_00046221 [Camellia sinensis var. sinensis]